VKPVAFAVAPDQSFYLAGTRYSNDFPVQASAYRTVRTDKEDVFVAHLSPDLGALLGATYISGRQEDAEYPTTPGALQEEFHPSGGVIHPDGFVSRFDASLQHLEASTFLGDIRQDHIHVMARDGALFATIVGFPAPEPAAMPPALAAALALSAIARMRSLAGISSRADRDCGAR
jgi:hypothetical protein